MKRKRAIFYVLMLAALAIAALLLQTPASGEHEVARKAQSASEVKLDAETPQAATEASGHTSAGQPEPTNPPEECENELIEAALKEKAISVGECTVTFYTCSVEECGKDDGITASGVLATPEVSVAVDPEVIPLGCDVLIVWPDGTEQWCRSDDTGGGIKGNHIDLNVADRTDALNRGRMTATVYYVPADAE